MTPSDIDSQELLLVLKGVFRSEPKARAFLANHPGLPAEDLISLGAQESRRQNALRIQRYRQTKKELPASESTDLGSRDPVTRETIIYQSLALALSALPYRETNESHIVKTLELQDGTILVMTISQGDPKVRIPSGLDRLTILHLTDEAVKNNNPEVSFGSAREFVRKFGIAVNGPAYKEFLASVRRVAKMKCTVTWIPPGGSGEGLVNPPEMIRYAYLPTEHDVDKENAGERNLLPYIIRFGDEFYEQLIMDPLPLSLDVVIKIRKKRSFLAWDLYQVIQYLKRRGTPGQPIYVHWKNVASMLGAEGEYVRKLRYKVDKDILKDDDYSEAFAGVKFQGDLLEIPPDPKALTAAPTVPSIGVNEDSLIHEGVLMPLPPSKPPKPSTRPRIIKERIPKKPKP